MLSETKYFESFSNVLSGRDAVVFFLEPIRKCACMIKACSIRKQSISVGYLLSGSALVPNSVTTIFGFSLIRHEFSLTSATKLLRQRHGL